MEPKDEAPSNYALSFTKRSILSLKFSWKSGGSNQISKQKENFVSITVQSVSDSSKRNSRSSVYLCYDCIFIFLWIGSDFLLFFSGFDSFYRHIRLGKNWKGFSDFSVSNFRARVIWYARKKICKEFLFVLFSLLFFGNIRELYIRWSGNLRNIECVFFNCYEGFIIGNDSKSSNRSYHGRGGDYNSLIEETCMK